MMQQKMLEALSSIISDAALTADEEHALEFLIKNEDWETGLNLLSILAKMKRRAYLTVSSDIQYAKDLAAGYVEDMNEFIDELEEIKCK